MSGELQLPRLCVNIGYTQQLPAACYERLSGWLTSSHFTAVIGFTCQRLSMSQSLNTSSPGGQMSPCKQGWENIALRCIK